MENIKAIYNDFFQKCAIIIAMLINAMRDDDVIEIDDVIDSAVKAMDANNVSKIWITPVMGTTIIEWMGDNGWLSSSNDMIRNAYYSDGKIKKRKDKNYSKTFEEIYNLYKIFNNKLK